MDKREWRNDNRRRLSFTFLLILARDGMASASSSVPAYHSSKRIMTWEYEALWNRIADRAERKAKLSSGVFNSTAPLSPQSKAVIAFLSEWRRTPEIAPQVGRTHSAWFSRYLHKLLQYGVVEKRIVIDRGRPGPHMHFEWRAKGVSE
jgi:hypothetical protein